jgi:hypothetical protein
MKTTLPALTALILTCSLDIACGTANDPQGEGEGEGEGDAGEGEGDGSEDQTPPEGDVPLQAWLAQAFYQSWSCQTAVHDAVAPSPHGRNRICSNDALAQATTSPWPVGAAAVKELYDANDTQVGFAVYRKAADGTDGANWYWYEKTNSDGIVADGRGGSGTPNTICVSCHSHADDFAFTQVTAP